MLRLKQTDSSFRLAFPSVEEYEQQKGFTVIQTSKAEPGSQFGLPAFGSHDTNREPFRTVFNQRINAARFRRLKEVCPVFPGHLIPAPDVSKNSEKLRDRGALYYDQFTDLLSTGIHSGPGRLSIEKLPVKSNDSWQWIFISEPAIDCIKASTVNATPKTPAELVACLYHRTRTLIREKRFEEALSIVHSAWSCTQRQPSYTYQSISNCEEWLLDLDRLDDSERFLSVLFEIEGYAAFASAFAPMRSLGGGSFEGNWIDIGSLCLHKFRPTELCQTDRLMEELVNLVHRGFAPVVVNERMCVADGNHRLTAAWLWNVLCSVHYLPWDLSHRSFQGAVADFVHASGMHPVSIHEALRHLSIFLNNATHRSLLLEKIRPYATASRRLEALPATVLPEHLSGAVIKNLYDDGTALVRSAPELYDAIATDTNVVLPARGSYHFTDRALLPWFSVLPGVRPSAHRSPVTTSKRSTGKTSVIHLQRR